MYNTNPLPSNQQLDPAQLEPASPELKLTQESTAENLSVSDPEELFKQSLTMHEKAQEYWQSDLAKRGSDEYVFNDRKSIKRKPEITQLIGLLQHDQDLMETDPDTDKQTSRTKMIIRLYELLLEQAMSDMTEAKKILSESETKLFSIKGMIDRSDLDTLRSSRDVMKEAFGSQMLLNKYLSSLEESVSGYESFTRLNSNEEIDLSARFEAFMKEILGEYRVEADVNFDEVQNAGNYETVLAHLTKQLKTDQDFLNLLSQIEARIQQLEEGADKVEGIATNVTGTGFDLPMFGDATSTEMGMDVLTGSTNSTLPEAKQVTNGVGSDLPTYEITGEWQPNYPGDKPDLPAQKTPQPADSIKK